MYIERLELKNFRNYESLSITFDKGINILYGKNAQGKTNILEAVFAGCTSRSHKSAKDRELIKFGEEEAHVKVNLIKNEIPYRIDLHIKKNRAKGIAVNGVPLRKISDLFGTANVVFFSPEDLSLIKDGPAERRRFIDTELCQLDRIYTHDLISYNKVVEQKNKLLKDMSEEAQCAPSSESALSMEVYNEQLLKYGCSIMERRAKFIKELNGFIKDIHMNITGGSEVLKLNYEKNVSESDFASMLAMNMDREIKNGCSLTGPHRDDLGFKVNNVDLRKFGSQGQQKTASLSLKMAEISLVESVIGEKPVLLLDDVLSELDRNRQDQLLDSVKDIQTLLTCTGIDDLIERRFRMDKVFYIENGVVINGKV